MHPYIAIPATLALVYRAYSRNSLTPAGIITAAVTAVIHAIHPWSAFFALLVVFFLGGTAVTKVSTVSIEISTISYGKQTAAYSGIGQAQCQSTLDSIFLGTGRRRRCQDACPSSGKFGGGFCADFASLPEIAG